MRGEADRASQLVRATLQKQAEAAAAAADAKGPASEYTLHRDLERRITALGEQVSAQVAQLMPPAEEAQLADLDTAALLTVNDGEAAYVVRCATYALAMESITPATAPAMPADVVQALRDRAGKYIGHLRNDFRATIGALIEAAATPRQ